MLFFKEINEYNECLMYLSKHYSRNIQIILFDQEITRRIYVNAKNTTKISRKKKCTTKIKDSMNSSGGFIIII